MSRWLRGAARASGLGALLLAGGCASMAATGASPPPLSAQAQAERRDARLAWLLRQDAWSFSGRAAISKGGKGGSGRIEWEQLDDRRYSIALSAPVTRQSWRLTGDVHSESGRLEGLDGGPRDGEFAEELLLDATGWDVPLQQLGSWVRGIPAEGYPVEGIEYDDQGRTAHLRQAGWSVRYTAWRDGPAGGPALPARIEAEAGDARVRLVIEDWTFASP